MTNNNKNDSAPPAPAQAPQAPPFEEKSDERVFDEAIEVAEEALRHPHHFDRPIQRVIVVGAGPAGLPAAKALRDMGLHVTVYERADTVGGNWAFSEHTQAFPRVPESEADQDDLRSTGYPPASPPGPSPVPLSDDVHAFLANHHQPPTACYLDLFNNTRVPMLGSLEMGWPADTPEYVPHTCVHQYYKDFAAKFDLLPLIHFNTSLDHVKKADDGHWHLALTKVTRLVNNQVQFEAVNDTADAVVIATGEYHSPFVPHVAGLQQFQAAFPERVLHTKQFRDPHDYTGKRVLVIGSNVSAMDVSRLVEKTAAKVYLSFRGEFESPVPILRVVRGTLPPTVEKRAFVQQFGTLDANGNLVDDTIHLVDGTALENIDVVIWATGYRNKLPFLGDMRSDDVKELTTPGKVVFNTKGHWGIANLFKDTFVMSEPSLAIVGCPSFIPTTMTFDTQARALARVWSGKATLPTPEKMLELRTRHGPPCAPFLIDGPADRKRAMATLAWLNHHAEHAQLHDVPTLVGPPKEWDPLWEQSFVTWNEHIKDQERQAKELRQKRLNAKINATATVPA
ncbi:hypothetical protein BC940DRAFT_298781 [Gongronella butleri]|nr:hypothetical protein BC940DRAFT_298781 [Gongronella butleri]